MRHFDAGKSLLVVLLAGVLPMIMLLCVVHSNQPANKKPQISKVDGRPDTYQAVTESYDIHFGRQSVRLSNPKLGSTSSMALPPSSENVPAIHGDSLIYQHIYPLTDWVFYPKEDGNIGYDFVLHPGANPQKICIDLTSAAPPFLSREEELVIPTTNGNVIHSKPHTYQIVAGEVVDINSSFLLADNCLSFEVAEYDETLPLIIDPTIKLPTSGNAQLTAMAKSMMPTVELFITQILTPTDPSTGSEFTFFVSYGAKATDADPIGAKINLPLPNVPGVAIAPFGPDLKSWTLLPDGSLEVELDEATFMSGDARGIAVQITIPTNSLCDGTVFSTAATITADNAETPAGETSDPVEIEFSDSPPDWEMVVNNIDLGIPGSSNARYEVFLSPITSGISTLSDVTIEVNLPGGNISYGGNCTGGCVRTGNTLTWNLPTYTQGESFEFDLSFPNGFSGNYDISANFSGSYGPSEALCPESISNNFSHTFDFTPDPGIACINPTFSTFTIGETGTLSFIFENSGNIPLSNFEAALMMPNEIEVTTIPSLSFSAANGGIDYTISYETFGGITGTLPASGSYNTTAGSGAQTVAAGDGLASVTIQFNGDVPPGFSPDGAVSFSYAILATALNAGGAVIGANPRIVDTEPCLDCISDANGTYTCLTAAVDLNAGSTAGTVMAGCETSEVARTEISGPAHLEKDMAGDLSVFPEEEVTFTLQFQICGNENLTNGTITDVLPPRFEFVEMTSSSSNFPMALGSPSLSGDASSGNQTLTWDFSGTVNADLPADPACEEIYEIVYKAAVLANSPADNNLRNCFSLAGHIGGQPIVTCDASELTACVENISIAPVGPAFLSKSADLQTKYPGEEITYQLKWRVQGPYTATSVEIEDILPANLAFIEIVGYSDNLYDNGDAMTGNLLGAGLSQDGGNPQRISGTFNNLTGGDPFSSEYIVTIKAQLLDFIVDLPATVNNCFRITAASGANYRMDYPLESCQAISVAAPGPTDLSKQLVGQPTLIPTDEFNYEIRWKNAGPYAVLNATIIDDLPVDLEFIEVVSYSSNLPDTPDPLTVSTDPMDMSEVLSWEWPSLTGTTGDDRETEDFIITIKVRAKEGTLPGLLQNCAGTDPDQMESVNIGGMDYDVWSFRTDSDPLEACNSANVLEAALVDARKGIKGICDNEFQYRTAGDPNSGIGSTFAGGAFTYRLEITNTGNVVLEDIVLVDVLPYLNDNGVIAEDVRLTEWRPFFNGPITSPNGSDGKIGKTSYSFETNPCPNFFFDRNGAPLSVAGCTGPVFYDDPMMSLLDEIRQQIQTIKIEFDQPLGLGEQIILDIEMLAPVGTLPTDGIAWNTFAYQAVPVNDIFLDAVEPIKVGIQVKENPVDKACLGNFVWLDSNDNDVQDHGEKGINGVKVTLYNLGADNTKDPVGDLTPDDEAIASAYTTNNNEMEPGYYLFCDLDPGDYYVVFEDLPPNTSPVNQNDPNNNGVGADADDSDGNAMGMTEVINLMAGDENLTLDQGLSPNPDCSFGAPEIRVVCNNNGTARNPNDDLFDVYLTLEATGPDAGPSYSVVTYREGNLVDVIDFNVSLNYGTTYKLNSSAYPIYKNGGDLNRYILEIRDESNRLCLLENVVVDPPATLELSDINLTQCLESGGEILYNLTVDLDVGTGMIPDNSKIRLSLTESNSTKTIFVDPPIDANDLTFTGLTCDQQDDLRITATFVDASTENPLSDACAITSPRFDEQAFDYGDLDDPYLTIDDNDGPRHGLADSPDLFLGTNVDDEGDGQNSMLADGDDNNGNDETGVSWPNMMFRGEQVIFTVDVTNSADQNVFVYGFVDWDKDGDFEVTNGEIEMATTSTTEEVELIFDIPLDAAINMDLGARFRIGTVQSEVQDPTGFARDGEVEDYLVQVKGLDFGDLAAPYTTSYDQGPRHGVPADPVLYIGSDVDVEENGQPSIDAGNGKTDGDDGNGNDDEDGVTFPEKIIRNQTATVRVAVTNDNDDLVYVYGFIDWNGNGNFSDAQESAFMTTNTSESVDLVFSVPADAVINSDLGARFRVGTNQSEVQNPLGFAMDGEVEDYLIEVLGLDYGDLPSSFKTVNADGNPPTHTLKPGLYLGSCVDSELDGDPDFQAGTDGSGGDDQTAANINTLGMCASADDDEDGVRITSPMVPGYEACLEVTFTNITDADAVFNAWIDFDGDGTFTGDANEFLEFNGTNSTSVSLPNGTTDETIQLCFDVPQDATFEGGETHMRFRLSCTGINTPDGMATGGEIEDYYLPLGKIGNYVWEDANADGKQVSTETGLNGAVITLVWAGPDNNLSMVSDNATYTTTTAIQDAVAGIYHFCGLIAGQYQVSVTAAPGSYVPTVIDAISVDEDKDSDDPDGVPFTIGDPIALTTSEGGTGDDPGNNNNFPDSRDDLQFDFGYRSTDLGDLPDSYSTSRPNGPVHKIDEDLILGTCIDGELDGIPEDMAGLMNSGDDHTVGVTSLGDCTSNDDEDGIRFITPMIPGHQACISVTAVNNTGASAYLQAWIDFDGNGTFESDETIDSEDFNGGRATIDDGGVMDRSYCFEVPSDATFEGGEVFMRFRLSSAGSLSYNGLAEDGEVEDYKMAIAKVGNRIWEDRNYNGQQDDPVNDPGLNGIGVVLDWAGPDNSFGNDDDRRYQTISTNIGGSDGIYSFCGLIEGNYKLTVDTERYPTKTDEISDEKLDSDDGRNGVQFTIANVTSLLTGEDGIFDDRLNDYPDAQDDLSYDFGFVGFDYGDLPEVYRTSESSAGAVHVMIPGKYLGNCVDMDLDGNPGDQATGDDGSPGLFSFPAGTNCSDDEDGIVFVTPIIPGNEACVEVSYTVTSGDGYLNGWIDFDNDNSFAEPGDKLSFNSINGVTNPNGENAILTGVAQVVEICFDVPADATLQGGYVYARFRLGCEADMDSDGLIIGGEVEDYRKELGKVGNWVWFDQDIDGIQDPEEVNYGLNNLPVQLLFAGADGTLHTSDDRIYTTITQNHVFPGGADINGVYYFCGLIDGKYQVSIDYGADSGLKPSDPDVVTTDDNHDSDGVDILDSQGAVIPGVFGRMFTIQNLPGHPEHEDGNGDQDPLGGPTASDVFGFPDLSVDQSFDFGLTDPDYGDLPEGVGFGFATLEDNGGPLHIIPPEQLWQLLPYLHLGTELDADIDGQPALMADGDDLDGNDDEDGIRLLTPLVPGYEACIEVTVTMPALPANTTAYLQGWIDYSGNGAIEPNEQIITNRPYTHSDPENGQPVEICFIVPDEAVYYDGGLAYARFRISTTPGLAPGGYAPDGEVEDHKFELAKIGNFVWEDRDLDGIQDAEEPGFNNIELELTFAGDDDSFGTGDDKTYRTTTNTMNGKDGQYSFCGLIPGNYLVNILNAPDHFISAIPDCSADDLDSDGHPTISFTLSDNLDLPVVEKGTGDNDDASSFHDEQKDETFDFGFIPEAEIKSSLTIKGVDYPESDLCGQFNVIYEGCIKNTGELPLEDLHAFLDLADPQYLGNTFVELVGNPEIISTDAQVQPTLNSDYDGTNDLLIGDGLLYPGQQFCFRFTIEVHPEAANAPSAPMAQVSVNGKGVNYEGKPIPDYANGGEQLEVTDLSDSGMDPMSTNPSAPGDTGSEDDPTPLTDCWKQSQQISVNNVINLTINTACEVFISPDLVIENYLKTCGDDLPLGGYYRVQLASADGEGLLPNPFDASNFSGRQILFVVESVARHCVPFWGKINLADKTGPTGCIRKVVALHKQAVNYAEDADYFLQQQTPADIDGEYYVFDPVTNEASVCGDQILDNSLLTDPNTNLLICTDLDSILNVDQSWTDPEYVYYTGIPSLDDNCLGGSIQITKVYDELTDFECGYGAPLENIPGHLVTKRILRTFTFEDPSGNSSETTQEICFFKPIISLPNCKEYIDVCTNDNLDPTQSAIELAPKTIRSAPYYVNGACQKMSLTEHFCNTTVTFQDQILDGPENCGFKVIRTWTILDWCWNELIYNGPYGQIELFNNDHDECPDPIYSDFSNKTLRYEQHLIIGDQVTPIVLCPEAIEDEPLIFSTGPFDCTGAFEIPAPILDNRECQYTWTAEVYSEVPVLWHGVPTGDFEIVQLTSAVVTVDDNGTTGLTDRVTITNVPVGRHFLNYVVTDQCGNIGTSAEPYCEFYVIDKTPPVAVVDANLTVSVTGNSEINGIARIYASDVDEGSSDNCSEVLVQVRRFVSEEALEEFRARSNLHLEQTLVTIEKEGTTAFGQEGYWTSWADYVDFICSDLAAGTGKVLVEMGVWDNGNKSITNDGKPIYQDLAAPFIDADFEIEDNFHTAWLEVLVEDKLPPNCMAPHDIFISCEKMPAMSNLPQDENSWRTLSEADQQALRVWFTELERDHGTFAIAEDNCEVNIEMVDVLFNLHCNTGYIERQFQATDAFGLSSPICSQRIHLRRHDNYCIKFPQDVAADCVDDPSIPGVELFEYSCDLLAVSVHDERFDVAASDGSCYKILRSYRVLNWCQFDEDIDPSTPLFDRFENEFEMEPMVIGRDEDGNGYPGDEDVYVKFLGWETDTDFKNEIRSYYDAWGLRDYVVAEEGTEGVTWIDNNCDPNDYQHYDPSNGYYRSAHYTRGFYQYTQVIKVTDNNLPIITRSGKDRFPSYVNPDEEDLLDIYGNGMPVVCNGAISIDLEVSELCSSEAIGLYAIELLPDAALTIGPRLLVSRDDIRPEGQAFNIQITQSTLPESHNTIFNIKGNFPIGSHSLEVYVEDACKNVAAISVPFQVFDAVNPAPICRATLSVNLVADGTGGAAQTVWASDFVASQQLDCSTSMDFTIHTKAEVDALEASGETLKPNLTENATLTVSCSDPQIIPVYVYAWDETGNASRCEGQIIIPNQYAICQSETVVMGSIAGMIMTEEEEMVSGVSIELSGQMTRNMVTTVSGGFSFTEIPMGYDLTVTPMKDTDPSNGVSTYDLIIISKHILGVELLDSPYKMIAADVNNSRKITTLDMIQIRKLILSIDRTFKQNTSWRFVQRNHQFADVQDPWAEDFPEILNINNLDTDLLENDFVGIKIGDVNGDALPNEESIEGRSLEGIFKLQVKDEFLKAGEVYDIDFNTTELNAIEGYQFTLRHAGEIEIKDLQFGLAEEQHFGFNNLPSRAITTSWNKTVAANHTGGGSQHLFTVQVLAKQDIWTHDAFQVDSRYTRAEAYPANLAKSGLMDVQIAFERPPSKLGEFELYQNIPNPFSEFTKIGFQLPKGGAVRLRVHDLSGRVIIMRKGLFAAGYHEIVLMGEELPATSLLYYTIEAEEFKATKKMTVIR